MSEAIRESLDALERGRATGVLSALDYQFSKRLGDLYGVSEEGLLWALAIACRQEAAGHVCADLTRLDREGLVVEVAGEVRTLPLRANTKSDLDDWLAELKKSSLVTSTEAEDSTARPLVLDSRGRLYLLRAYRHEKALADRIRARAEATPHTVDWPWAEDAIVRLAPGTEEEQSLPRRALRSGLARPLAVVTGGPGTGKTTMVARLIALLVEQARESGSALPRVRLLAPTGKAAAAMANAFARGRESLDVSDAVKAVLPTSAETIHRALHQQSRLDAFGRPTRIGLEADVVIVDEASMVDLELMNRLFEACEGVGRVILLGDPGQLASVDAGAVLAEICAGAEWTEDSVRPSVAGSIVEEVHTPVSAGMDLPAQGDLFASSAAQPTEPTEPTEASSPGSPSLDSEPTGQAPFTKTPSNAAEGLRSSIVTLRKSHRFDARGGIGRLAEAIRGGDTDLVMALLEDPELPEIERCDVTSNEGVVAKLIEESGALHLGIGDASDPSQKLDQMGLYRVLCAHRHGPFGVESLSARLDEVAAALRQTTPRAGWWRGRMLLVTRNAPDQDLWNGDVGIIEETGDGLRALFPDGAGGVRALSAGRLPAHESAIAMSVHKSQGSEFDRVDLVLGEGSSPLLTRELLYTGVTRARQKLRIHVSVHALSAMIERRVQRDSGLGERLWAKP
jgi:exodeoxyribonuclease V alpha subunit